MSLKNRLKAIRKARQKLAPAGRLIVYGGIEDRPGVYNAICCGVDLGTGTEAELDTALALTDADTVIVFDYYDHTPEPPAE